jgi:hypothetical protein
MLDPRAVFVNALRISSDETRTRIFDNIEQHHAHDFGDGKAGIELYEGFLYALRDSGMPEVTKEFERRFFPLLSPSTPHTNADPGPREEMTDQDVTTAVHHRPRREWRSRSILYVAAFFGSFIIVLSAFSFR